MSLRDWDGRPGGKARARGGTDGRAGRAGRANGGRRRARRAGAGCEEADAAPERAPRGRRVAGAAVVVAVCALLPFFVNDAIGYIPLGTCLCMMAISAVYLAVVSRAVVCDQDTAALERVRGQAGEVCVALSNRSPLVLMRVEPAFSVALEGGGAVRVRARATLAPHERRAFPLDASFDHVGRYRVGVEAVEVFDLLGLFSRVVRVERQVCVRVVPRRTPLDRIAAGELSASEAARSASAHATDEQEYAYVRDYQVGDAMKTVHWKLSARCEGALYTKLFETHADPGVAVLLDFHSGQGDPEVRAGLYDTMLETAFSLVEGCGRAGADVMLAFCDRVGAVRACRACTPGDLDALMDEMPRLGPEVDARLVSCLLGRVSADPSAPGNVVVCTSELSEGLLGALEERVPDGRRVRVLLAVPPALGRERLAARLAGADRLAAAHVEVATLECGADVVGGGGVR